MQENRLKELKRKARFVQRLGEDVAAAGNITVLAARLDAFEKKDKPGVIAEYVVVEYIGGARAVRCNNANSLSATYRNLGALLDGGYYAELKEYEDLANSDSWERVDLEGGSYENLGK